MNSILAWGNWAERRWMYSGHYSRIFVAPKNAQNAETKHQSGTVPILLLVIPSTYGGTHRPYSRLHRVQNMNFILARGNWVERHWMYSGHYPRIFVAPKNAQNAETKHQSGAVPILLLVILASITSAYSSLNILKGLNPRPWLLKALVYHSATSAKVLHV
jgi:hypothetical protein